MSRTMVGNGDQKKPFDPKVSLLAGYFGAPLGWRRRRRAGARYTRF